jgi:hypothetical protein
MLLQSPCARAHVSGVDDAARAVQEVHLDGSSDHIDVGQITRQTNKLVGVIIEGPKPDDATGGEDPNQGK